MTILHSRGWKSSLCSNGKQHRVDSDKPIKEWGIAGAPDSNGTNQYRCLDCGTEDVYITRAQVRKQTKQTKKKGGK
jgi:hypothetical protein